MALINKKDFFTHVGFIPKSYKFKHLSCSDSLSSWGCPLFSIGGPNFTSYFLRMSLSSGSVISLSTLEQKKVANVKNVFA